MKIWITLVGLVITGLLSAQTNNLTSNSNPSAQNWVEMMQDPNANFYDIQKAFNAYWQGKTVTKGKGYKVFRRWEAYMAPRVYPTGELTQVSKSYENFQQWQKDNPMQSKSLNGNWTSLGPVGLPANGGAGRVNFVRVDPNNSSIIYLGTPDGGLWKSTNSGTSFSVLTDNLTVIGCSDIAIDPSNSNILYLATGDGDASDTYSIGVLKSTDGGSTWNATGLSWTVDMGRNISRLLINPNNSNMIIAATSAGIYRTTDAGATWIQERTGTYKDAEFKPGDPNTVYAAGSTLVKSTDAGNNWTSVTSGLPTSGIQRIGIAVTAANPAYVYLLIGNNSDYGLLGVYRSTDSGANFTRRENGSKNLMGYESDGSDSGGQAWYDLAIAANPSNAEEVYVGGVNIWKSTNGGTAWNCVAQWQGSGAPYVHADQHDLVFQGSTLYSGNDGGFFKTTNGGSSWSDLSQTLVIAQQYRISQSSNLTNLIVAGHQDNGSNIKNGTSWSRILGGDGMDCLIDRTNNSVIYVSFQYGGHYRSTDGGFSLTDIYSSLPAGSWVSPIHQDPANANTIYVGGRNEFYKSTNRGDTWTTLGVPPGSGEITEFAIAPSNNQVIYALQTNRVSKSTNGGSSFTSVSTGLPTTSLTPTYIAVSATDPNIAWVTFSGYTSTSKVYKTTNGGSSWTNISSGLPNVPSNVVAHDPSGATGNIYVGTDVGVYYRDDATAGWVSFSTGLPVVSVRDLEIHSSGKLRAGTYGRGTWESDLYTNVASPPTANFSGTPTLIFQGSSVNFTDLSTGTPTSRSWSFPGGTPSSSTGTNPVITYNTPGTYDASLTVSNAAGSDTETKTAYIIVQAITPPVADFTATQTSFCPGLSTAFSYTGSGSPTSYSWSFPGGTPSSSTSANPTITYSSAGTYSVTLTASNGGGSDTETKTGYIVVGTGTGASLPFTEGFVSGTFPPSGWSIVDAGGNSTWVRSTSTGLAPTSGNSMIYDNYANNDVGFNDDIRMTGLNLSTVSNPSLSFDLAYAPYDAANFDGLEILISTDCGVNFTSIYSKSGTTLATAAATTSSFVPGSGDWRRETVSLNAYSSANNAILAYRNLAGYGNVLYIDNINIDGSILPPTASFTASSNSICAGESVTFTNTSTGNPTGYSWSLPGATPSSSTAANPSVVYNTPGTYSVSLTATNAAGSHTASVTGMITVKSLPAVPTISTSGPTTFCNGGSVVLTSSSATGNTWSNGATTSSITVNNTGAFFVSVSANGCTSSSSPISVSAVANPVISLGTVQNPSGCTTNNGSIQINGSGTGNINWTGASTGSMNNIPLPASITNLGSGSYTVTFATALGCQSNTLNSTLTSPSAPATPTISASGPLTFCQGGSVTLTSSSAANNVWSTGANTQAITVSSSGTYTLVVQNVDCQSAPASAVVVVHPVPSISLSSSSDPTTCGSSTGSMTIAGSGTGDLFWSGTSSSGNLSAVSLPATINNLLAGNYDVSFTSGCNSNVLNVTLNDPGAPPAPIITPSGTIEICDGDSVELVSSATSNNTWNTGENSISIVVKTAGTYSVITESGGCFSTSLPVVVNLIPSPVVSLSNFDSVCVSVGTFALNGGSPSGGTYSGNGVSGGAFSPAQAGIGVHTITYSFTNGNGCTGIAQTTLEVTNCAGLNDLAAHGIQIYPNPANEQITLVQDQILWKELMLTDLSGKVILKKHLSAKEHLDVKALADGVYQLVLSGDSGRIVQQIHVVH